MEKQQFDAFGNEVSLDRYVTKDLLARISLEDGFINLSPKVEGLPGDDINVVNFDVGRLAMEGQVKPEYGIDEVCS